MNKVKREELRKYREAREGLTAEEIRLLDEKDAKEARFKDLVESIHHELFPEEYDFRYDSIADAQDRARGINPMSEEYIAKVNLRRVAMGVALFDSVPTGDQVDSWTKAREKALQRLEMENASTIDG